jgi:hypothetical protein
MNRIKFRVPAFILLLGFFFTLNLFKTSNAVDASEPVIADSTSLDSMLVDSLLADSIEKARWPGLSPVGGKLISDLLWKNNLLWVVGDSGLVAWSEDDSIWTVLSPPDSLAFNCLCEPDIYRKSLICAGDSGRIFRVLPSSLERIDFNDQREIIDIEILPDGFGLLCGSKGLLAKSLNYGKSWDVLEAPLPMRFHTIGFDGFSWWIAGSGGFVFRSDDLAKSWQRVPRKDFRAVVDLEIINRSVYVLLNDGRVEYYNPDGSWKLIGQTPWFDANFIFPAKSADLTDAILVGGSAGRMCWFSLDGRDSDFAEIPRLDSWTDLNSVTTRGDSLIICGAWGMLASYNPQRSPDLHKIQHALFGMAALVQQYDSTQAGTDSLHVPIELFTELDSVNLDINRYMASYLDTPPRHTDAPTRFSQLLNSYNIARNLNINGIAYLMLDIDRVGKVENVWLIDEYPQGLGFGKSAQDVASSMMFTPGFVDGKPVLSRIMVKLPFVAKSKRNNWYDDFTGFEQRIDTLLQIQLKPYSQHDMKELVKEMGFPRKAKRNRWAGWAIVEYDYFPNDSIARVESLTDSDEKYDFGAHVQDIIRNLEISLPSSLELSTGHMLRTAHKFDFDRKRYKKLKRAKKDGFKFEEALYSYQLTQECSIQKSMPELLWVWTQFYPDLDWDAIAELNFEIKLKGDGTILDLKINQLQKSEYELDQETLDVLATLALQFAWIYPAFNIQVDETRDVIIPFNPQEISTEPVLLPPHFEGVVF